MKFHYLKKISSASSNLFLKNFFHYIKSRDKNMEMKKNPEENFTTVEVDAITGEYYINIPEWVLSEFEWYEGTVVNMEVDGETIIITEVSQD